MWSSRVFILKSYYLDNWKDRLDYELDLFYWHKSRSNLSIIGLLIMCVVKRGAQIKMQRERIPNDLIVYVYTPWSIAGLGNKYSFK